MTKNEEYAATYGEYAMEQMKRYGIPASVTLAQGILESSNGQSELSEKGNAHFGIKCTGEWLKNDGTYLTYTDDRPDEKFCTYASVADSYEHHSSFLKENIRYKECFALSPDDYRGWCMGLQRAGYASGGNYAGMLQQIIEKNGLNKYDQMVMERQPLQQVAANQYAFPLERKEFMLVTSPFGMRTDPMDTTQKQMHKGIDIKASHEAVLATETGGKVIAVNENAGKPGGKSVSIEYGREDGTRYQVSYLHLDSIRVKTGETVKAGQQVGVTGNTGARTTGEHLHVGVQQVALDGNIRDLNPAVYLADLADKGNIRVQLLSNGENLLAKYASEGNKQELDTQQSEDGEGKPLSVEEWMKKILSSEDAGIGTGGDPIMEMVMTLYTGLMALATQFDGNGKKEEKTREQQMQAATEACLSRKIDISSLVPSASECRVSLPESGKPTLEATVGGHKISRELTTLETNSLTKILGDTALPEADKQQRIGLLVTHIIAAKQASVNYEQGLGQEQQRQEGVQRN